MQSARPTGIAFPPQPPSLLDELLALASIENGHVPDHLFVVSLVDNVAPILVQGNERFRNPAKRRYSVRAKFDAGLVT